MIRDVILSRMGCSTASARPRVSLLFMLLACTRLGCGKMEDVVAADEKPPGGVSGVGASSGLGNEPGGTAGTSGAPGTAGASDTAGTGGTTGAGGTASTAGEMGMGGGGGADQVDGAIAEFPFVPTNFDPVVHQQSVSAQSAVALDCGTSTFDSSTLTFGNWCEQPEPIAAVEQQPDGPELVVLSLTSITISSGATLRLTGSRPVVLAVFGDVVVAGTIDANASGTTPGAGGNWSCGDSQGADGSGSTLPFGGASGGGGGGHGTAGGKSGTADTDVTEAPGATGGVPRGATALRPLLGGCAGGRAGDCATEGGAGGGAIQISAARSLTITGAVLANGGTGRTPCGAEDEGGGTGGGSGGAILLEGRSITTSGAQLEVNGGDGGSNGAFAGIFSCGAHAGGTGSSSPSEPGGHGVDCQGGGPGGGGGYGRILTLER